MCRRPMLISPTSLLIRLGWGEMVYTFEHPGWLENVNSVSLISWLATNQSTTCPAVTKNLQILEMDNFRVNFNSASSWGPLIVLMFNVSYWTFSDLTSSTVLFDIPFSVKEELGRLELQNFPDLLHNLLNLFTMNAHNEQERGWSSHQIIVW